MSSMSWIVTTLAASSTDWPARAIAYARRPATLIALYAGGRCSIDPRNDSSAAVTAARVGAAPPAGVRAPSRSSVVDDAPKQTVARYRFRSPRWYSTRRGALPRKTGSTPLANGSSVPPCPTRFVAVSRRTRPTTSWDVGPIGFAMTRTPSRLIGRPCSADDRRNEALGLREDGCTGRLDRQGHRRAGGACMAAAAEGAGEHGRVDAAGPRPDADPRPLPRLLEQDRYIRVLRLGEEVDDPLAVRGDRARGREVGVEEG